MKSLKIAPQVSNITLEKSRVLTTVPAVVTVQYLRLLLPRLGHCDAVQYTDAGLNSKGAGVKAEACLSNPL